MEKKVMQKIEDGLCEVLEDFAQKGINTASDVATVKHALSGIEKMKVIEAMEYGVGASGRYPYPAEHNYDGGSYRGNMSSRRGYSRTGFDRGYSGHDMRQQLERMLGEVGSERERMAIEEALQKM